MAERSLLAVTMLGLVALTLLGGCSNWESPSEPKGDPPSIESVEYSPDPVTVGRKITFTVQVSDPDGPLDIARVWVALEPYCLEQKDWNHPTVKIPLNPTLDEEDLRSFIWAGDWTCSSAILHCEANDSDDWSARVFVTDDDDQTAESESVYRIEVQVGD